MASFRLLDTMSVFEDARVGGFRKLDFETVWENVSVKGKGALGFEVLGQLQEFLFSVKYWDAFGLQGEARLWTGHVETHPHRTEASLASVLGLCKLALRTGHRVWITGVVKLPKEQKADLATDYMSQAWLVPRQGQQGRMEQVKVWECFCGGFGGWGRAVEWLQTEGVEMKVVGGFDWDRHACECYVANLGGEVVSPFEMATEGGKLEGLDRCKWIFVSRVQDKGMWSWPTLLGVSVFSISAPCQSFSQAGREHGWASQEGAAMAWSLAWAGSVQAQVILVENVAKLRQKKHFWDGFLELVDWIGYRVLDDRISSLSEVRPAIRNRLLCVLVPKSEKKLDIEIPSWPMLMKPSLIRANAWIQDIPEDIVKDWIVDIQALDLLEDPRLLPAGWMAQADNGADKVALGARLQKKNEQMSAGILMASYTSQHLIPLSHLLKKGLLTKVREQQDRIFLWTGVSFCNRGSAVLQVAQRIHQVQVIATRA